MLRFEDELRKKDLIFAFVHEKPAHCAVFCISILVRRNGSKFKQAMTGKEKGRECEAVAAREHTKLGLEAMESWQFVGLALRDLYRERSLGG